ncbi:diguanylate cyclase [Aliikangiella maris]|uniref:GGDEF domain-containing protein n=2 Tax=Aliikangiella maris TaxID=3162458 RepID=A0ABV2BZ90_9GAMM
MQLQYSPVKYLSIVERADNLQIFGYFLLLGIFILFLFVGSLQAKDNSEITPHHSIRLDSDPIKLIEQSEQQLQQPQKDIERINTLNSLIMAKLELSPDINLTQPINQAITLSSKLELAEFQCHFKLVKYRVLSSNNALDEDNNLIADIVDCAKRYEATYIEVLYLLFYADSLIAQRNYSQAAELYIKAFTVAETIDLVRYKRIILMRMAHMNNNMNNIEEAHANVERAIATLTGKNQFHDLSLIYMSKAYFYESERKFDSAEKYYKEALTLATAYKNIKNMHYLKGKIAYMDELKGNIEAALKTYLELYQEAFDKNYIDRQVLAGIAIANIYYKQRKYEQALTLINEIEEKAFKIEDQYSISQIYKAKSNIFEKKVEWKKAYFQLKEWIQIQHEIYQNSSEKDLNQLLYAFEISRQENENTLLKQKEESQAIEIKQHKTQQHLFLAMISLFILSVIYLLHHAVQQRKVQKKLAKLALTDELTGSSNRRDVLQKLEDEISRAQRYQHSLTIAIIDLDYFKKINDNFGHETGDKVLIAFAKICKQNLRASDLMGRVGGEEWLLAFPHTTIHETVDIISRIQADFREKTIPPIDYPLTFSVGVTNYHDNAATITAMTKNADEALYEAKNSGRNKIVVSAKSHHLQINVA